MVAVTGYQLDDTATYSCNMGFELVGSATTTCTQLTVNSAAFSPVAPVCRRKWCIAKYNWNGFMHFQLLLI